MLAILSAPGSRGDVNPMIAIGRELRQQGFDVVISISEPYAPLAEKAGLQTEVIISTEQFHQMVGDPSVWKAVRGVRRVLTAMSDHYVKPHHEVIRKHHRPGETILLSHPLDYASRVIRESDPTTRLFNVHLQPVILRTPESPTRLTPWWFEPSGPAWLIRTAYWMADHFGIDPVIRPAVNRLRREYGFKPIRRILSEWWLSPDRIIAMYPKWFAPATEAYCPRLVHAGFPLQDIDGDSFTIPEGKPIVFTAGTAHHHSRKFFQHACDVCVQLNRSGILLSSHQENFPESIPSIMRAESYLSLGKLLPHCGAIVHHGGVGTTSQAFAAGIPQIIRPMAFDQFDNATRIEKLGCGAWLRRDRDLAKTLSRQLDDPQINAHCRQMQEKLAGEAGAKEAAQIILDDLATL